MYRLYNDSEHHLPGNSNFYMQVVRKHFMIKILDPTFLKFHNSTTSLIVIFQCKEPSKMALRNLFFYRGRTQL